MAVDYGTARRQLETAQAQLVEAEQARRKEFAGQIPEQLLELTKTEFTAAMKFVVASLKQNRNGVLAGASGNSGGTNRGRKPGSGGSGSPPSTPGTGSGSA